MLLRKTSAAIAFLVPEEFAFMVSFRRLTEEREMRRIGLSLDRRAGVGAGVGRSCGKDPGMVSKLGLETRADAEGCNDSLASVQGTPRKSEKKVDTLDEEYACKATRFPHTIAD